MQPKQHKLVPRLPIQRGSQVDLREIHPCRIKKSVLHSLRTHVAKNSLAFAVHHMIDWVNIEEICKRATKKAWPRVVSSRKHVYEIPHGEAEGDLLLFTWAAEMLIKQHFTSLTQKPARRGKQQPIQGR